MKENIEKEKFTRAVVKAIIENNTRYTHVLCTDGNHTSYTYLPSHTFSGQMYDFTGRKLQVICTFNKDDITEYYLKFIKDNDIIDWIIHVVYQKASGLPPKSKRSFKRIKR